MCAFLVVTAYSTMETKSQRPKGLDGALSSLGAAIDTLDLARDTTGVEPAKDAFVSVILLLIVIKVRNFCIFHVDQLLTDAHRIRRSRKQIASN